MSQIARISSRPARVALRVVRSAQRLLPPRDRTHLLIACMPKSGSSFLVESLLEVTGFERRNPLAAGDRHENDLYEPALIDAIRLDTVAQIHVRASEHNLDLMNAYGWRPIVLVRDLGDVMVSLRDHIINEGPLWSMLWVDERFANLDDADQLDALIDLAAPWFINFFVSWTEAARAGRCDPLWLNYADWTAAPSASLARIASWSGLDTVEGQIEAALARVRAKDTRLNVGRPGRGAEVLTDAQRDRLNRFARHYRDIDFEPIGLTRA